MKSNWWKAIASFLLVLFTMPLGHALMMIMEKTMTPEALHYSAFFMGLVGLLIVIAGVFVKGDTKQTLFGLIGGLLFWTGWVEFLFQYYATRWGTQPEIENGEIVTKPEYLILPATFGMWMMVMTLYIFSTKNGCNFINWCQRTLFRSRKNEIAARPMTHHTRWQRAVLFCDVLTEKFLNPPDFLCPATDLPFFCACRPFSIP